jgi:acyl carrier protein
MTADGLRTEIHQFIQKNFLFDDSKAIDDDQSLLASGIVDSTGILELISHLEGTYRLKFADSELVADNFDSVNRIIGFITPKLQA